MDHPQSQTQTQKDDFISSFFDENLTNGEMALDHQSNASIDQNQLNMDFIGNLMSMHVEGMPAMTNPTPMQLNSGQQHSSAPGGTGPALGSATVSQQFKLAQLQQLQQLQNQIFQQQIALISGGGPAPQPYQESNTRYPEHNQNYGGGLPTPGPSPDFVLYGDYQNREREPSFTPSPSFSTSGPSPAFDRFTRSTHSFPSSSDFTNRGTTSAPAHIAFSISDMEPDISPLTSPWLGGVDYGVQYRREQSQPISQTDAQPFPESHTPTDLADSQGRSRRKRAASSTEDEVARKKQSPAIRASNSTRMSSESSSSNPTRSPVIKAKRRSSKLVESPSTKALDSPSPVDMPPPIQAPEAQAKVNSTDASLQPVTPASMMNIGLGRGRVLKAILPSSKPLASSSSLPSTPAALGPRKTSHKAAEQKRRDSLKSTFDDLRGLLPDIPLGEDEASRPLLPGALPPRGPPKAGGEGPNKGVSKLQLLICGNAFIRCLKDRVDRRDNEIGKLRDEVRRLRALVNEPDVEQDMDLDLDRDLDADEVDVQLET